MRAGRPGNSPAVKTPLPCLIYLFLCLPLLLPAQDRGGNVVEYFGKEKVNDVSEGRILHLFDTGLILTGLPRSFAVEPFRYDAVLADFVGVADTLLNAGDAYASAGSDALAWDTISIGARSAFAGEFRGGYLYLRYDSDRDRDVVLEASGHTTAVVNGVPHEGDHYDFGWSLIPLHLRSGANYILLSGGRFNALRARLLEVDAPVQFTSRDLTLPDLLPAAPTERHGAVRIMNVDPEDFAGGTITASLKGATATARVDPIVGYFVRKVPFLLPTPAGLAVDSTYAVRLELRGGSGEVLDTMSVAVQARALDRHHKETFVSAMDGSVQYYSVAPPRTTPSAAHGLVLSVHGASVEAVNQANAYRAKDSLYIVAATNRRPFGFAWEDWGRRDGIEVLDTALARYGTDPLRTYLTGHSMGGHGTWHLGANYPDRFAAIGPAAGYADLIGYRQFSLGRLADRPDDFFARMGTSRQELQDALDGRQPTPALQRTADLLLRAGSASRTLQLKRNFLHYGVYILHGSADNVVPTGLARQMRGELAGFHDDFAYYEYPGGEHWFGDQSVDWPPLFEFFDFRRITSDTALRQVEFATASPGVSAGSHYVAIWQQDTAWAVSSFALERRGDTLDVTTTNVRLLRIDVERAGGLAAVRIDGQVVGRRGAGAVFFRKSAGNWAAADAPGAMEKQPRRYGGFKDAFSNGMVLVYATGGTAAENSWYRDRARYDAERWYYRGNGSVPVVADTDFDPDAYADRNVILYGNRDNNAAWGEVLDAPPFDVTAGTFRLGDRTWTGNEMGGYLVFPRAGSETASVGVVTATGAAGMYAAYANDYFLDTTFFPDVLIITAEAARTGLPGVLATGFFGNAWDMDGGAFEVRE